MKAITKSKYGGPEVLRFSEVDKPSPKAGELLVQVAANAANPADWHILRGAPFFARFSFGLFRPKHSILGADFAGTVVQLGAGVTDFKLGDRVFGESLHGAFAEYLAVPSAVCAPMPEGADFPTMACVTMAGLTAWQALVSQGRVQVGERVLINGSSGGVGHLAVQIAKELGARVTAVCSSRNVDFVRALGADEVIAYDQTPLAAYTEQHDLVLDVHGNLRLQDFRRLGCRGVMVGFTSMGLMLSVVLQNLLTRYPLQVFTAAPNAKDLQRLAHLVQSEAIRVHIDKTFAAQQIPEAIAYIEAMRTRGKVAMVWEG